MEFSYIDFLKKFKEFEFDVVEKIKQKKTSIDEIPDFLISENVALTWVVAQKGDLSSLPFLNLNNIVCLAACQFSSSNLTAIPDERRAWVVSHLADPFLKIINDKFKSPFICKSFVEMNGQNIKFVPESLLNSRSFIETVCTLNPRVLCEMDLHFVDEGLVSLAMQSPKFSLNFLPNSWKTKANCLLAFENDYKELIHFPSSFIDIELIRKSIKLCDVDEVSSFIRLISPSNYDVDLVLFSVKRSEECFKFVPVEMMSEDLILALSPYFNKAESIQRIPSDIFNERIALRLVECNPLLLQSIPEKFRTHELCKKAVQLNGLALEAVPTNIENSEIYRLAVNNNGLSLKYIPTPYIDEEIPLLAVTQNGEAIEYVPESIVTQELCLRAVMQNPHAIYSIPKVVCSNDLYLLAIKQIPSVLKLVPKDRRTLELCLTGLEKDIRLLDYVPLDLQEDEDIKNLVNDYYKKEKSQVEKF